MRLSASYFLYLVWLAQGVPAGAERSGAERVKRVEWAEAERRGAERRRAKRGRDFYAPNVRVVRNLLLPTPLVVSHTTERSPQTLDGRGLASGRPLETPFKKQNNYLPSHGLAP